jgi:hypothetical protein
MENWLFSRGRREGMREEGERRKRGRGGLRKKGGDGKRCWRVGRQKMEGSG